MQIQKKVLTVNETCEYTGIKKSYLYKLMHWRKIPYSKPGGKLAFFDKVAIDKWLLSNPVSTDEFLEKSAATYLAVKNKKSRIN